MGADGRRVEALPWIEMEWSHGEGLLKGWIGYQILRKPLKPRRIDNVLTSDEDCLTIGKIRDEGRHVIMVCRPGAVYGS